MGFGFLCFNVSQENLPLEIIANYNNGNVRLSVNPTEKLFIAHGMQRLKQDKFDYARHDGMFKKW